MKPLHRRFCLELGCAIVAVVAVALLGFLGSLAWSQPARPIKIIVPFSPSGAADVIARVVAEQVGNLHGPTMIVENHPDAGTLIATQDVVRAAPDGTTLLFSNNSLVVVFQLKKVDYDPLSSLAAICNMASTPSVIVVDRASPYRTLNDFLDAARAKPGDLTFGGVPGAVLQIGFEMLQHAANVHMTLIPYTGTLPEITAVLGGQIVAALVDYPAASAQLQAGTLRALAVGSAGRIDQLPDVPTIAESGVKDCELDLWYGMFAPAKVSPEVVAKLGDWFDKAAALPATISQLRAQGVSAVGQCGSGFGEYVRKQYDTYGRVIREANLKAE
jgi:tripartite-type tricarboxylate transporter receptor subunit TctC